MLSKNQEESGPGPDDETVDARGRKSGSEPVDVEAVRLQVLELCSHNLVTQAQISRECGDGVSIGTLSPFLKGKYTGDQQAVARKLQRWLVSREAKAAPTATSALKRAPEWVETELGGKLLRICAYAQLASDFAVIHGGAGLGKTTALRRYASQHNNAFHIEVTAATGRLLACLDAIASKVGTLRTVQRPAWLINRIISRLSGAGAVLLIDEAQHLDLPSLESIRAIHDATGCGVVLAGNSSVYQRISGSGSRSAEFAQLFSRIGRLQALTKPSAADVDALVSAWGIKGKDEREFLRAVATKPGALRAVTKTLRMAFFESPEGLPDLQGLQSAYLEHSGEQK